MRGKVVNLKIHFSLKEIMESIIFFQVWFRKISHNGKQIGDSGGLDWTTVQFRPTVSRCVSTELTYKFLSECGTHSADKKAEKLNLALNPPFCQSDVSGSYFFIALIFTWKSSSQILIVSFKLSAVKSDFL